MMEQRKLILYIAMSLDGFIAGANESLDFLSIVEQEGEDYGYAEFNQRVDTIVLGRKTYDKILAMGHNYVQLHADKQIYVHTRTPQASQGNVHFYTDDIASLIAQLKSQQGKHIYCDGGAETVRNLLKNKLIDEFIISIIPILLGNGTMLFQAGGTELLLQLVNTQTYPSGLVQLHYIKK